MTNQERYAYNATGNRTLKRTTNSATTMTVYAFGLAELVYSGSGTSQSSTYYYSLGGHLLGSSGGSSQTQFFVTDALGSVLTTFNNATSSAAVQGDQVYGPYGNRRSQQGSMATTKGYTGQYADAQTGLDYYNARYYDPRVGVFLSADTVQGNTAGMDPYSYGGDNPETKNDPSGHCPVDENGICYRPPTKSGKDPTGGCGTGMHSTSQGCVNDKSGCLYGMQLGKGGCVYDDGECAGKTVGGCNQFKLEQRIHRAQDHARQEAAKLMALAAGMLLLLANLPLVILRIGQMAEFAQVASELATMTGLWIAAAVYWGIFIGLTALATFLSGSVVTLALGAVADGKLGALFEQQADDNNPADWTSTALDRFSSEVNGWTTQANNASMILSVLTGNGYIGKLIGGLEPTTDVFYRFQGIDATLAQMKSDMNA